MKKIVCLMLTILLMVGITINVNAAFETCRVNTAVLNCRTLPSTKGEIITKFSQGTELQIIGAQGKWWQVYDGVVQGWCHSAYLSTSASISAQQDDGSAIGKSLGKFKISYYTCSTAENGGWNLTAKGQKLTDVVGICIAADPKVIPYYSKVYIEGIGVRTVLDCGGAIKGKKIDVLVRNKSDIPSCGVHYSNVYLLE